MKVQLLLEEEDIAEFVNDESSALSSLLKLVVKPKDEEQLKDEIRQLEQQVDRAKSIVSTFGRNLDLILDEVESPFDRARALRNLAIEAKKWGGK